jgi:cell shape-determining protein MreC
VSVEPDRATALLLGDPDVRIPVVIDGTEGIVLPSAGGVVIDQVVGEVSEGKVVTTSGIEGIYPPGLLVGSVGAELPSNVFGRFVLSRPFNVAELTFVSVRLD